MYMYMYMWLTVGGYTDFTLRIARSQPAQGAWWSLLVFMNMFMIYEL